MPTHPGQLLWQALESVPGRCYTAGEWRQMLATDFAGASQYLRAEGRLATSYPCPARPECGCIHRVVQHGVGRFVGVCVCDPPRCTRHSVARGDVALVSVDIVALAEGIAGCLGLEPRYEVVPGLLSTWGLGTYRSHPDVDVTVYLSAQMDAESLGQIVHALAVQYGGPFALVLPTRRFLRATTHAILRRVGGYAIALSEQTLITDDGTIAARTPIEGIWAPLLGAILGASAQEVPASNGPGQPCLGLGDSEVRVVRAYQEWEARRGRRRGLPTLPRIDDLEAETGLSRPTVIDARKALRREAILEQVPDARPGVLRLTSRGLHLHLPSDTSTVKPSVK